MTEQTQVPELSKVRHVLPDEGFVRLRQIIGGERTVRERRGGELVVVSRVHEAGVLPMSKSAWLRGVKTGLYPRGVRHGTATLYRVEDVRALLAKIASAQ